MSSNDPMSQLTSIAGIILAGGRSRRMAGRDKSFIDLGGKPLIAHAVARLRPQVAALAINANADPAAFSSFARLAPLTKRSCLPHKGGEGHTMSAGVCCSHRHRTLLPLPPCGGGLCALASNASLGAKGEGYCAARSPAAEGTHQSRRKK
jgi:hypothetical protein